MTRADLIAKALADWADEWPGMTAALAAHLDQTLPPFAPEPESPVTAFQKWVNWRAKYYGPMSQEDYILAQSAFFSAHPGEGPKSAFMAAPVGLERTGPDSHLPKAQVDLR